MQMACDRSKFTLHRRLDTCAGPNHPILASVASSIILFVINVLLLNSHGPSVPSLSSAARHQSTALQVKGLCCHRKIPQSHAMRRRSHARLTSRRHRISDRGSPSAVAFCAKAQAVPQLLRLASARHWPCATLRPHNMHVGAAQRVACRVDASSTSSRSRGSAGHGPARHSSQNAGGAQSSLRGPRH